MDHWKSWHPDDLKKNNNKPRWLTFEEAERLGDACRYRNLPEFLEKIRGCRGGQKKEFPPFKFMVRRKRDAKAQGKEKASNA